MVYRDICFQPLGATSKTEVPPSAKRLQACPRNAKNKMHLDFLIDFEHFVCFIRK